MVEFDVVHPIRVVLLNSAPFEIRGVVFMLNGNKVFTVVL